MQNNHDYNSTRNINKIKLDSIHLEILYRSLISLKKNSKNTKKK